MKTAGKGAWLRVVLTEGRKRQIREIGSRIGLPVVRILRVRIGSLQLGGLKPGEWRYLAAEEISALKGETGKPKNSKSKNKTRAAKKSSPPKYSAKK